MKNSVISSFGISVDKKNDDVPSLYWIPKLHKTPYKQRFIAGSSKCTTKPLSVLLTSILTAIKSSIQKYFDCCYSRNGVNQMWILKNSKELMENLHSKSFSSCNSIKTFDFSTLYTSIPHSQLKSRLAQLIKRSFIKKNGKRRYKYLVVGYKKTYFVIQESSKKNKFTEDQIIEMLNFLIDNIFVQFGGRVFQQTIGIPMGTNCAPLIANLFLHSYEANLLYPSISHFVILMMSFH